MTPPSLSWVEVDLDALKSNLGELRRLAGQSCEVMPVVKSNAYGHGAEIVVRALLEAGVNWLGVNAIDEALQARTWAPAARILVLGYVDPARFGEAVAAGLDLTLTNVEEIPALDEAARGAGRQARLHIKVEAGTHRRGVPESEFEALADIARDVTSIEWAGISTHFANIEDTLNHDYAEQQLERFRRAESALDALGVRFQRRHVACTAATLLFPETHLDMVRVGIGLYGLWPSRETLLSFRLQENTPLRFRPCLAWKTRIVQAKRVAAGEFIGYGCSYRTAVASLIGIIPIGYFEGYDRSLSNSAYALVRGRRAPIRGRVCMNMTLLDLTHVDGAAVGDEVVLIGRQGDETVTADDLAAWSGTINYEIVSRIHPALPRVAVRAGSLAAGAAQGV